MGGSARAEVEDVMIPMDAKGTQKPITKEGLIRGKRLFNAACANCHIGGSTRTNQYDGLKEIYEVHPSIKGADVWPKMRSMKNSDLADIGSYIFYQNATIPEKWGGGKTYY